MRRGGGNNRVDCKMQHVGAEDVVFEGVEGALIELLYRPPEVPQRMNIPPKEPYLFLDTNLSF